MKGCPRRPCPPDGSPRSPWWEVGNPLGWRPGGGAGRPPTQAYAGVVSGTETAPGPGPGGGHDARPGPTAPDLDDGDPTGWPTSSWRVTRPKGVSFVSAGPSVVEGIVNGTAVRALCGKEWVPGTGSAALRAVPHVQGDRRVDGVEDPGQLRPPGRRCAFVPGRPPFATVRRTDDPCPGRAARREHVGTGQLRRRHQAVRRHHRGR